MDKVSLKLLKQIQKRKIMTLDDISKMLNCKPSELYLNEYLEYLSDYLSPVYSEWYKNKLNEQTRDQIGYKLSPFGSGYLADRKSTIFHKYLLSITGIVTAISTLSAFIYSLCQK